MFYLCSEHCFLDDMCVFLNCYHFPASFFFQKNVMSNQIAENANSEDMPSLSRVDVSSIGVGQARATPSEPEIGYLIHSIKSMGFEIDDNLLLKLLKHHNYHEEPTLDVNIFVKFS
jgi:hypothetical protein